ncbi:MAG: sensor histidine kinase [Parafannyhessea sp.]|uniref:sensor histidine kinase n=1 Tax=Parafannyhessea sp. TaxID=2847324 RepID=UPI003F0F2F1F
MTWGLITANLIAAVVAGAGLAVDIVIGGSVVLLVPEDLRSQATERMLRVSSSVLKHMNGGLTTENCTAVGQLLLPETTAAAIVMSDDCEYLAVVGGDEARISVRVGDRIGPSTSEVISSGRMQTFSFDRDSDWRDAADDGGYVSHEKEYPVGVVVPLVVQEHTVGTIGFLYNNGSAIDRTQLTIARGFGELLSTQLSAYELDRQAELTARAEVKALQAQINPHFLFNTLNTIASLTRTDPTKARDLLREFSSFYRHTLESSQSLIPLSEELEQTRRYLKIEKARFGEDRILESESVEPGCEKVMVPGFIVQPIVENAVRHAMRDEGPLSIDIQVVTDGDDVLIAVADDGLGMSEDVADRLLERSSQDSSKSPKGTGIALRNVAERLRRFYGGNSNLEIMSKVGEGTVVTLRLANVAPKEHDARIE